MDLSTDTLIVFAGIVVLSLVVAYVASRYKYAGPDEALLRYDHPRSDAPSKVVRGPGYLLVLPVRHSLARISLRQRSVTRWSDALTSDGRAASVRFVATDRVGDGDVAVRDAADRYIAPGVSSDGREVDADVTDVVADALSAKAGTTTLADLEARQDELEDAVRSAANAELARSGLVVDRIGIEIIAAEE